MGGIQGSNISNVVIQLDGKLIFSRKVNQWPRDQYGGPLDCINLHNLHNVTITSSTK